MREESDGASGFMVIAALAYLATVPLLFAWFMPFIVAGFSSNMGFSERSSGSLISADMLGYTLGTLIAARFLQKLNWRRLAQGCLVAVITAYLIACAVTGLHALIAVLLCAGLASGLLSAVALGASGRLGSPEWAYGLWQVFQALAGMFAGLALPGLIAQWSTAAAFAVIVVAAVIGIPLTRAVPLGAPQAPSGTLIAQPGGSNGSVALLALGIFLVLGAIAATATYLVRIGAIAGLNGHTVGLALSAGGVASLVGGAAATRLGERFGRIAPTLVGCSFLCVAYIAYASEGAGAGVFICITALYYGAYSYVVPYFLGSLASADASGRSVSLGNAALGAGMTIGPGLGGWIVAGTSVAALCYVAASATAMAAVLALPLQARLRA
jgi:MFS transporter, DHA1 family, inner membrane transport protein